MLTDYRHSVRIRFEVAARPRETERPLGDLRESNANDKSRSHADDDDDVTTTSKCVDTVTSCFDLDETFKKF